MVDLSLTSIRERVSSALGISMRSVSRIKEEGRLLEDSEKKLSSGSPNYLTPHRNGNSVAVAMNSGSVRIYDIRTQKLQQHYVLHDDTSCVDWHPTANYLLSSGRDGKLRIIDIMEGRPLYTLSAHESPIFTVKFSYDGEYFASGGADKHIMVWKTNFITRT